jgi:DNA polymerase IV
MRKIIHVDMDCFFAAVEMRDNPALRNVPIAIGGSSDRRGVISTANYPARKFGVRSAMPTATAMKLCPHLVLVRGNMRKYVEASERVFEVFHEYTDLVQPVSIDEAYLDVTNCDLFHNSATWIAEDIRKKIFERTGGLTASAGVSTNKLLAKLASDFNKPDGKFTVPPDQIENFITHIPVERIPGIGKVTAKRLHDMGLKTCLDLQQYSPGDMIHLFGKFGETLYDFCRGKDDRQIETEYERKSLGTEETYSKDIYDIDEMKEHVKRMVIEVKESLEDYDDRIVKNLHVKIKYYDFKQTTIERRLPFEEENFIALLEERWYQDPRPVRLLGVGVKFEEEKVSDECAFQLTLLTDALA